ncbi:aminotransferase class IV [Streptomyces sp. RB6PN25]|uniref:Aminotransferase class IV n=1 Tax=Streptomyces humicola TaxID=2953240 RepID=A0ABT1PYN0_9ACTN|nr:aminotransferase class IV [Streptomyces humicola]MCQ4082789.1 aminotransferase class IV [Streptomyces humicola]
MIAERLRWSSQDKQLEPLPEHESAAAPLRVADSWLADAGRVRRIEWHAERFLRAVVDGPGPARFDAARFFEAAVAAIPEQGRWFPRVELVEPAQGSFSLRLWLRPAPEPGSALRMWASPRPDRRLHPTRKGPDLDLLATLRAEAVAAGADEALLLDDQGRVLEGTTTSLLWWRGDVLCAPVLTPSILPGVTRRILLDEAARAGIRTVLESPAPELRQLDGLEVWAVNALHGIRPVAGWVGKAMTAGEAVKAPFWRAQLDLFCSSPLY